MEAVSKADGNSHPGGIELYLQFAVPVLNPISVNLLESHGYGLLHSRPTRILVKSSDSQSGDFPATAWS